MAEISQNFKKKTFVQEYERVPPCYKEVEKVIKQVKTCQGNFKTVMSNSRLRGSVFKKVYALVANVLKNWPILERIIEDTELLVKEPYLRKEFAGILIYETIFGKGLPGESKPIQAIRMHEKEIKEAYNISKKDVNLTSICTSLPRYARVNTIATSVYAVLGDLRNNGFQQVTYDKNTSLDGYMNLVKSLQVGYFLVDYHFKDLLVFASKENLPSLRLHQSGQIFIQDKSSYIPVHALNPKPGDTVLDACAAPGMKTVHIAAAMKNEGKIYAYERDKYRFETLKGTLDHANVTICEAECEDFYLVNADDPKFQSLECILVDPSCSGSGMVSRMDSVTDTENSKNKLRLQKLAGFQILLLKHALLFRSVKRVVYSTCSVTEEENEFVVHEVLNKFGNMFKLVSVMPDWPIRGSDNFEYGHLCLRAYPNESLTNGFFVAMFERLDCCTGQSFPLYNNLNGNNKWSKRDNKRKNNGGNFEASYSKQNENECVEFIEEEKYFDNNSHESQISHNFNDALIASKQRDLEGDLAGKKHKKSRHSKDQVPELIKSLNNATEKVMELKFENYVTVNTTKKKGQNIDEINENSVVINMETDLEQNAVQKKHKKKKHSHKDQETINEENFADVFENTTVNELATKKKQKKKKCNPKDQETVPEENLNVSEMTLENDSECSPVKKKRKRKQNHSEDQETSLDGNALRVKMDEDIENEKKLYNKNDDENQSDCVISKKHKKKKSKDSIEKSDSTGLRKKSKSLVSSENEGISLNDSRVSEKGNENSELCLENQPMTDLLSKKKHKKKCKTKKKQEE